VARSWGSFPLVVIVGLLTGLLLGVPGRGAAAAKAKSKKRSASATNSATTASTTSTTTIPAKRKTDGVISGLLRYPAEEIPPDLVVCLEKLNPGGQSRVECSNEEMVKQTTVKLKAEKLKDVIRVDRVKATFLAVTEPGIYYVFAQATDASTGGQARGYYTEYTRCGLKETCQSHRALRVQVIPNGRVTGIVCCDFWVDASQQRKE
jgi:hypothetical protein